MKLLQDLYIITCSSQVGSAFSSCSNTGLHDSDRLYVKTPLLSASHMILSFQAATVILGLEALGQALQSLVGTIHQPCTLEHPRYLCRCTLGLLDVSGRLRANSPYYY